MELDEIKEALKDLSAQDRRKVALYIFELEKEHVQKSVGPQLTEDLNAVSKIVQEAIEKLKRFVNKG
jgi:DNA-directed RNA polymerase specialized sigma subunit